MLPSYADNPILLQRVTRPIVIVYLFSVVTDVHATHVNVAGRVLYVSGQHFESGRLPGSVRAQQAKTLVGFQGEVQSFHRLLLTVLFPDVAADTQT